MASIRRKSLRVSAVINQLDLNLDEVHGVLAPFKGSVEGSAKGCVASFGIVEGNVCNRGLGLRVQGIPSRCWGFLGLNRAACIGSLNMRGVSDVSGSIYCILQEYASCWFVFTIVPGRFKRTGAIAIAQQGLFSAIKTTKCTAICNHRMQPCDYRLHVIST